MLFLSMTKLALTPSILDKIDGIELRLDFLADVDFTLIQDFLQKTPCPVMFTLRKASHGGKFQGSEQEREGLIQKLLELGPHFFDLEYDMRLRNFLIIF